MGHPVVEGGHGHPVGEHTLQAHEQQPGWKRHSGSHVVQRFGVIDLTNRAAQLDGRLHLWGPKKKKRVFSRQDGLPGSFPPWPDPQRWCSPTPERWCWPSSGGCVRSPGRSAEGTPSPLQGHEDTHTPSLIHNTELMLHNTTVQSEQTFSTVPAHTEPLWAGTDRPVRQRVRSIQSVNRKVDFDHGWVYSVVSGIKMYILFWFLILFLKRDAPARPAERHVTALILLIWSVFTAVSERTSSMNYWLLWLHKRALSLAGWPSRLGNYPPAGYGLIRNNRWNTEHEVNNRNQRWKSKLPDSLSAGRTGRHQTFRDSTLTKHEEGKQLNNIRGNVDVNEGSIVKTAREKRLRAERENWGRAEWW